MFSTSFRSLYLVHSCDLISIGRIQKVLGTLLFVTTSGDKSIDFFAATNRIFAPPPPISNLRCNNVSLAMHLFQIYTSIALKSFAEEFRPYPVRTFGLGCKVGRLNTGSGQHPSEALTSKATSRKNLLYSP